jgi:hypothetical protein
MSDVISSKYFILGNLFVHLSDLTDLSDVFKARDPVLLKVTRELRVGFVILGEKTQFLCILFKVSIQGLFFVVRVRKLC